MARNRKRAKERRARRPQPVASNRFEAEESPDPIRHAAPDVELAEAQLAVGRPELIADEEEPELDEREFELEAEEAAKAEETADGAGRSSEIATTGRGGGAGREAPAPAPAGRQRAGSRLITFFQGSWRELQRVQWPDRRQVMQATGVVIGFVIVAGIFLGVADTLSSHVMNYVLNGHW